MPAQHAQFVKRSDEPLMAAVQEGDGGRGPADRCFIPHLKFGGRIEVHEFDRAIDTDSP
jgi:hypothetical protein